jgi:hypothetical protein
VRTEPRCGCTRYDSTATRYSAYSLRHQNSGVMPSLGIHCDAAQHAGAPCVSLYVPFKGNGSLSPTRRLGVDGDHPNAAGHRLFAQTLLAATPERLP